MGGERPSYLKESSPLERQGSKDSLPRWPFRGERPAYLKESPDSPLEIQKTELVVPDAEFAGGCVGGSIGASPLGISGLGGGGGQQQRGRSGYEASGYEARPR